MADLVIRGMEMPKMLRGEQCYVDVCIFADGSVVMAKAVPPYYQKFKAVSLPEGHGRLIDADTLQEEFKKSHDGKRLMLIDTAPTIVPAE